MARQVLLFLCAIALFAPVAGAIEIQVEGPQDSLAGAPTINHCTLRKAVINANDDAATYPQCQAGAGLDTITIPAGMTITFALAGVDDVALVGDLDITDDLIIEGNGATVNGADIDRVFHVHPGVTLTIRNLNIVDGNGNGGGGGIWTNGATVNLENVTIASCNGPNGDGGAILADSSILNLTSCTISGNFAAHHAGAIAINGGAATITNSTITGNDTGFSNLCGGIRNAGGATLRNTIVAGNGAGNDLPNLDGFFLSQGYNVIGDLGSVPGNPTFVATTGDQTGVTLAALHLGALQNNGGNGMLTHALLAGSVARDKGHSSGTTTDERGLTRPCDEAGIPNATGGDGGDVGAYEEQGACGAPNAPPDAVDDFATFAEDSGAHVINVLTNDTDANSDPLSISAVTQGAHGSVTNNGGSVSYTPSANFHGSDSFTYTISDGFGADTATVFVTVTSVNDLPVAVGESYTVNGGTTLSVAAPGVLANDSDIDGDVLHPVVCTTPVHGSLTLNFNGSFSYTPVSTYSGPDWFTYRAHDGIAGSGCVTVAITIVDHQPPVITASLATTTLWSPNSKLVDVGLSVSVTDNTGTATTTVAVYSDEDDGATKDASGMLSLRAERDGTGDGRVYLIVITATDAYGNASHKCLTVVVPKSQSDADVASVNAQAVAAVAYCNAHAAPPPGWFVVGD